MKTVHLLASAATLLLIAAGTASAQNSDSVGAAPAPPAIQNAPAEKIAPPMNAGSGSKSETTGQSGTDLKFGDRETTGQSPKSLDLGNGSGTDMKGADDFQSRPKQESGAGGEAGAGATTRESGPSAGTQGQATTGQGAAAGAARLSNEQRSQIAAVIQAQDAKPLDAGEVNFAISVGSPVPRHLHFYSVPQRVAEVYPAWKGYRYILVGDQIVVIEPTDYVIVAVLEA